MTRRPDRPDSLDLLPGESARPPLRLLERPAPNVPSGALMTPASPPRWLARWRHVAWRALTP